jgi:hypothetical protein
MLNFVLNATTNALMLVTSDYKLAVATECTVLNRNDWATEHEAAVMADEATKLTGKLHIATDAGAYTYPRFDVIEAPQIGAEISRAFNGDYYPEGKIAKISPTLKKITTDTGNTFYRQGNSGRWLSDGIWSMVPGHVAKWNREF